MNRSTYCILLMVLVSSACSKEDNTLIDLSEQVQGTYKCTSMVWGGEAIDVDGDGNLNTNFFNEFTESHSFSNWKTALSSHVHIRPLANYNQECLIQVEIPMQFLKYDKVSNSYSLKNGISGGNQYLFFSYSVREGGTLSFFTRNDRITYDSVYFNGQWEIEGVDYPTTCGHHVIALKEGFFSVQIIGTYYDFASQQLVTGPVNLTYERVSYSVN